MLHVAPRPWATTGAVIVGVGLIAATPGIPPLAGIQHRTVQLSADFDPITPWIDAVQDASKNLGLIAEGVIGNGFPALMQYFDNQTEYAETLFGGLQAAITGTLAWFFEEQQGNNIGFFTDLITEAIDNGEFNQAAVHLNAGIMSLLFSFALPLQPATEIPGEIGENYGNVVDSLGNLFLPIVTSLFSPLFATEQAFFNSLQEISDADGPQDSFSAMLNMPAVLADAFYNGYERVVEGAGSAFTPGLFSPLVDDPALGPGPLAFLVQGVPQLIAEALGADSTQTMSMLGTSSLDLGDFFTDPMASLDPF